MRVELKDLDIFLKDRNFMKLEDLYFNSDDEFVLFLDKIDMIYKNKVDLNFVNNDVKNIILELDFSDSKCLNKLRSIAWNNLYDAFLKRDKNSRLKKLYEKFILFVREELGLSLENCFSEKKHSKLSNFSDNCIVKGNKSVDISKDSFKDSSSEDYSFLKKKDRFDINLDTDLKVKTYGIDLLFDYRKIAENTTINDFTLFFIQRLDYYTKIITKICDSENLVRISVLDKLWGSNESVMVIGLLSDFSYTKNGHLMLTIEDKSGSVKCFINKGKFEKNSDKFDKNIAEFVDKICLDEGVGIIGNVGDNIIWVNEVIVPTFPFKNELKKTDLENYFVCLSDIHCGTKLFIEEEFQKFIDWINGNTSNEKLNRIAEKVKYILVAGDLIEGVGIFPEQEKELSILLAESQYKKLAMLLSQIPKDKCIIMIPGNHDATRLLEPQIKMPYEKAYPLYNLPNVVILSNPAIFNLFSDDPSGGLNIYMYHGGSIFYYGDKIKVLRVKGGAQNPNEVVKYFLEKMHISPSHGAVPYIPDNEEDPLVIKKNPDFFITGHTHKIQITNYRGCTIISAGCWSKICEYQKSRGMVPDVGKAIIVNTKTRNVNIFKFYEEGE